MPKTIEQLFDKIMQRVSEETEAYNMDCPSVCGEMVCMRKVGHDGLHIEVLDDGVTGAWTDDYADPE